jgi:hypothetical protein
MTLKFSIRLFNKLIRFGMWGTVLDKDAYKFINGCNPWYQTTIFSNPTREELVEVLNDLMSGGWKKENCVHAIELYEVAKKK